MISPLVRRRRLAVELRALREAAGLTAEHLAKKAGLGSRATISRLETAERRPDPAAVMTILTALGVDGDRWNEFVQVAHDAALRGWWDSFGEHMGARQRVYADLEYAAATIREYQSFVVPGLVQTPAYTRARAELSQRQALLPAASFERAVEAKLRRQQVLGRTGGPVYEVVIDEVAIHRPAAPAEVMRAQTRHLAELAGRDGSIKIRVLPVRAKIRDYWLPRSPFSLYTYHDPKDPQVAAVDTEQEDLVYTEAADIAPYAELFERLEQAALSTQDSAKFLAEAAEQVEID